jgi:hypothetical protein
MFLVLDEFGELHFFLDKRLLLVHYKPWVKACLSTLTPASLLAFLLFKTGRQNRSDLFAARVKHAGILCASRAQPLYNQHLQKCSKTNDFNSV